MFGMSLRQPDSSSGARSGGLRQITAQRLETYAELRAADRPINLPRSRDLIMAQDCQRGPRLPKRALSSSGHAAPSALSRRPRGAQPRSGAILVLTQTPSGGIRLAPRPADSGWVCRPGPAIDRHRRVFDGDKDRAGRIAYRRYVGRQNHCAYVPQWKPGDLSYRTPQRGAKSLGRGRSAGCPVASQG